jgi:hypothetical protein
MRRGTYTKVAKDMTAGYTADALFDAIVMDSWPSSLGPLVDFGLDGADSQKKYEALYGPIGEGEITKMDLRKVVGDGPAITKLVNRCRSNPHRGIKFTTVYDGMQASIKTIVGLADVKVDIEYAIAKAYKKISDGIPSLRKHKAFHDELEKMIRAAMEADAIANSEFLLEYARSAG